MNSGLSKIAILGLGLIGGSLAAAFKWKKIDAEIVGIDQTPIVENALGKGLIDAGHEIASFRRGVRDADLVILSMPVRAILQVLAECIMAGGNYNVILCERGIRTFTQ